MLEVFGKIGRNVCQDIICCVTHKERSNFSVIKTEKFRFYLQFHCFLKRFVIRGHLYTLEKSHKETESPTKKDTPDKV